jgi:hypothetical protein
LEKNGIVTPNAVRAVYSLFTFQSAAMRARIATAAGHAYNSASRLAREIIVSICFKTVFITIQILAVRAKSFPSPLSLS